MSRPRRYPKCETTGRMTKLEEQIYAAAFALALESHLIFSDGKHDQAASELRSACNAVEDALGAVQLHRRAMQARDKE